MRVQWHKSFNRKIYKHFATVFNLLKFLYVDDKVPFLVFILMYIWTFFKTFCINKASYKQILYVNVSTATKILILSLTERENHLKEIDQSNMSKENMIFLTVQI